MGLGQMTRFIDIVKVERVIDAEGFSAPTDVVVASVRAYKEGRHGSERWANRAAFSSANALFKFRVISGLEITTEMFITDESGRYRIVSVEDVRGRKMYIEILAEKLEGTVY